MDKPLGVKLDEKPVKYYESLRIYDKKKKERLVVRAILRGFKGCGRDRKGLDM